LTTSEIDAVGYTLFLFGFESTGGIVDLTFTPNDYSPEPNFMLDNVSVTAATVRRPTGREAGILNLTTFRKKSFLRSRLRLCLSEPRP